MTAAALAGGLAGGLAVLAPLAAVAAVGAGAAPATAVASGAAAAAGVPWALLGGLALLAGALALDETALAQTWLSQPLPAALLAGLLAGDVGVGLAIGLPLQLVLTMNLPVGQTVTGDASGAAIAAVGAAVWQGQGPAPLGFAATGPQAAVAGWLLLGAAVVCLAGHPLVQGERRLHLVWMLRGRRTLRDGRLGRIEAVHALCLLTTFARGALFAGAGALALGGLWLPAIAALPSALGRGLALLPWLAAALGLGAVLERYGVGRHGRWVAAGLAAGWLLGAVT